jgi:hypothetical protein
MVKAEKEVYYMAWIMLWEERVSIQFIFSHLRSTAMDYRSKQTKELGQGTKVCIVKQSQS